MAFQADSVEVWFSFDASGGQSRFTRPHGLDSSQAFEDEAMKTAVNEFASHVMQKFSEQQAKKDRHLEEVTKTLARQRRCCHERAAANGAILLLGHE